MNSFPIREDIILSEREVVLFISPPLLYFCEIASSEKRIAFIVKSIV